MFLNQLNKYHNNDQRFFYFDGYIVELSNDDIRFGVARGGHSGGYWFVPTITELDGKTIFCGTIEHNSPYTSEKGGRKIVDKIKEILLWIIAIPIMIPIIVVVEVYLFFSWLIRKIFKRSKPKEESLEDKLYNLMENHLGCIRQ